MKTFVVICLLCLVNPLSAGELAGTILGGTTLSPTPAPRHFWLTNPAVPEQWDQFSLTWDERLCEPFEGGMECRGVSGAIGGLESDELSMVLHDDRELGLLVNGPLYDDWGVRPFHLEFAAAEHYIGVFELQPTDREKVAVPEVADQYGYWHFSAEVDPWPNAWGQIVPGDSNGDGLFNSRDIVQVFRHGLFETGMQADWTRGDWNHDGLFDSTDLVEAFQAGNYETAAVSNVPEPQAIAMVVIAVCGIVLWMRGM